MQSISKTHRKIIISVTVIILIAAAGVVGYVYWNTTQKQKMPSLQQTIVERKEELKKEGETSQSTSKDSVEGYLILKDWGVKFKIPDGMGEVVYYKKSFRNTTRPNMGEMVEGYEFTTKRVEDLGGRCADSRSDAEPVRLGAISRSKTKQEPAIIGPVYLNDSQPINGYYYTAAYAQAACTMKDLDVQSQDRKLIGELLQSIVAV